MTTLEQAVRALAEDHVSRAARMAATAAGDEVALSTAGAWMQAGESLLGIIELDRDDDTTPREKLSQSAEVTHQLTPVVGLLRRALAAAAGVQDVDDITNLPETVFLAADDAAFVIERITTALGAIDRENKD